MMRIFVLIALLCAMPITVTGFVLLLFTDLDFLGWALISGGGGAWFASTILKNICDPADTW